MAKDSTSKTIDSIKWIISLSFFTLAVVENRYFVETACVETSQTFMVVLVSIVVLILILWGIDSLLRFLTQLVLG